MIDRTLSTCVRFCALLSAFRGTAWEPNIQVSPSTEGSVSCSGQDDYFDTIIDIDHFICPAQILLHNDCKGIVLGWPIEGDDEDRGGRG
jgi:hypothetical protein